MNKIQKIYTFTETDIVIYNGIISRYVYFKIFQVDDSEIRFADRVEIDNYYKNWNNKF